MSLITTILPIIRSVFSRWTGLQLAVMHSMGGPESEAKYEAFIEAFGDYLTRNIRSSLGVENEIQEYLDEVLDEEFNTVLDDGSSLELAQLFVRYINLILQGKLCEVEQELQLQQSITAPVQMSIRNENDDDSSSDESSEEEKEDKPKRQSMETDEDGWTTVHRKRS